MSAHLLKYIVVHCTGNSPNPQLTGLDISRYQTTPAPLGRGWKVPGYWCVIRTDGTIDYLVKNDLDQYIDDSEITNGVRGINYCSLHIAYIGGLDPDSKIATNTLTSSQITALSELLRHLKIKFPWARIVGHNELSNKQCPCFDVQRFLQVNKI